VTLADLEVLIEKNDLQDSFDSEVVQHGLRLCPAYINTANIMIEAGGKIVVLDFRATCFLRYTLFTASYGLVPYQTNEIGEHISFIFLASRSLAR
jgi:hypothetical protein